MRLLIFVLILILSGIFSCSKKQTVNFAQYQQEIRQWRQERLHRLTRKDGWLSLAGLFWLHEGENTFGFGKGNDIRFPGKEGPARLGSITLQAGSIRLHVAPKVTVYVADKVVRDTVLHSDADGRPTVMRFASYLWYVIKRGERYAIRLKNTKNPAIKNFKGIAYFPIDLRWRIPAKFVAYHPAKPVSIPTVLGTTVQDKAPGYVQFKIKGRIFRLDVFAESASDTLSTIFADETNGKETYGAGRFLEIDPPDAKGMTVIDFNKAYNPPCAFTEFATCPMPPKENILAIRITAGEKYSGQGHHH